jgi:hypothetical protein
MSEPALYILLTFHAPSLISIFFSLGRLSKESVQIRDPLWLRNKLIFYGEELSAPRPTPKLEDHPLSPVRDCLFTIFVATSIRNLRTRHAVVTRDPRNMEFWYII